MAKIEIKFTHAAGVTEQEWTIPDADFARFVAAAKALNPEAYTDDEVAMFGWQNTMAANIVALVRYQDRQAAVKAVSDINLT